MPITVQAGLRFHEIVGCAVRTETAQHTEDPRCARRNLRLLHPGHCYAFRSRAVLTPATVILPGEKCGLSQ